MLIPPLTRINRLSCLSILRGALFALAQESPAPLFALPMGVEDDWYPAEGTSATSMNLHIYLISAAQFHREPTTITEYNPTACISAWASYVTDDFKDITRWQKNWLEIFSWKVARSDDWQEQIEPFMVTDRSATYSTTTYWSPAPTPKQCDGADRVVWASESTATEMFPTSIIAGDNATGLPAEIDDPYLHKPQRFPICEIRPEDCEAQWSLFQSLFSNWTAKIGDVNPFIGETNPTCMWRSSMCYPDSLLEKQLDINSWMILRGYQSARGFLSHCPQFEPTCKKGIDIYEGVVDLSNSWRGCDVKAGRFALLYFRGMNNTARDLCANDGWGEDVKTSYRNSTDSITNTAVVQSVVFQRHGTEPG
jgi:hypothetical protein